MIETIYLHVGPHKTGSTTIQEFLGKNATVLHSFGYLYPYFEVKSQVYFNHSRPLKKIFFTDDSKNDFYLPGSSILKDGHENWQLVFDTQFRQQLSHFKGKNLIISGEVICRFSVCQLSALKKYLVDATNQKVKIKIILLTRHPVDLFQSDTIEIIKDGWTLDDAIENNIKKYRCFYQAFIGKLLQVFDRSSLLVYSFEESICHPHGPAGYFMLVLGAPESLIRNFSKEQYNPSLPYESIVLLSAINKQIPPKDGVPYILSTGIRDVFINLTGQKFHFSPSIQREIWNLTNEDVHAVCHAFLLPEYKYQEKQVPPFSAMWTAETLNYLHFIFVSATKEAKLIILNVLIQELKDNQSNFNKKQKNGLLKFIIGASSYIPISERINNYHHLFKHIGYNQGLFVMGSHFVDKLKSVLLEKNKRTSLKLDTLAKKDTPKQQIENATCKNSCLCFTSAGVDPWFILKNPNADRQIQSLSVKIQVPKDTICQIYYTNTPEEAFSESKSIIYFASEGINMAYFEFLSPGSIAQFRFDPGKVQGDYIIHSITINQ
jgi:hypothetical protein